MNALQELIQGWIDAEPGRSVGVLAKKADMPRNTIYAIMGRTEPAGLPREENLRKLARGLGEPYGKVKAAAERAAGYGVTELDPESQEFQAWVAMLGDLPKDKRDQLWALGRHFLALMKEEP